MGALTIKQFPFELRNWEVRKLRSIDPTSGFAHDTVVYLTKNQVILIEPVYNSHNLISWITDKGRLFFDGIFHTIITDKKVLYNSIVELKKHLINMSYVFKHCKKKNSSRKIFNFIVNNVGLDFINLLLLITQTYKFVQVNTLENCRFNNNLESECQLNSIEHKLKLDYISVCLLLSCNSRYEGYYLNMNLRQRFFKGYFKCLILGSLLDLTFPTEFLGSSAKITNILTKGCDLTCQDFKTSRKFTIICSNDLFNRNDGEHLIQIAKALIANIRIDLSCGVNILSNSIAFIGKYNLIKFKPFTFKSLSISSLVYFINVSAQNNTNLQKITELNILSYSSLKIKSKKFVNQNYRYLSDNKIISSVQIANSREDNCIRVPSNNFYEGEETFINTEGFLKKTCKIISNEKTSLDSWNSFKLIRNKFKAWLVPFLDESDDFIKFCSQKTINFSNYIHLKNQVTKGLCLLNYLFTSNNNTLSFVKVFDTFKASKKKIFTTKLKYWVDDFFIDNTDEYSQNSATLAARSEVARIETTTFF